MKLNKNSLFLVKLIVSSLIRRRSRIAVALLGVIIGATVLLGMITLCYDVPRQLGQEFRSYGANLLFMPKNNQSSIELSTVQKAIAIFPKDQLLGVTPFRYATVRSGLQPYTLVGTDFKQIIKTSPYWRVEGQYPSKAHEILIGTDIATFAKLTIGDKIPITGTNQDNDRFEDEVTITGIIKTGRAEDGFIFIDITELTSLLQSPLQADVIEVSVNAPETQLKHYVTVIENQSHIISPQLIKWVIQSESSVLGKLSSLLYLVTFIVLILTMICVATTMMAVVMERRNEIGLKKALGAENKNIATEFLIEGVIIGLVGGIIGAICGVIFAQLISHDVFGRSINVPLNLIPLTMVISILVTVIACLIPIKRAVEIEPARILRGE